MTDTTKTEPTDFTDYSIDPTAAEMLKIAEDIGVETVFSRSRTITPCSTGATGALLQAVRDGSLSADRQARPRRLRSRPGDRRRAQLHPSGRCGHGGPLRPRPRRRARVCARLRAARSRAALSPTPSSSPRSPATWASRPPARTSNQLAVEVADCALAQFGQQTGELVYIARAPEKRQKLWRELDVVPRGIDREIVEAMHRTARRHRPELRSRCSTPRSSARSPAAGAARCSPPTCRTSCTARRSRSAARQTSACSRRTRSTSSSTVMSRCWPR